MKDIEIFEILVRQHEKMLLAYVLGIVRDQARADDILQEAFLLAFRKLSTLENKAAFPAWLRTIARNVAFQELKAVGREVSTDPEILSGMEDIFGRLDSQEQGDTWPERVRVVKECFERLPETLLSACQLHYFEDCSTKEIAERLKIGLEAVLKRLERARDAIRLCVEKKLEGGNL